MLLTCEHLDKKNMPLKNLKTEPNTTNERSNQITPLSSSHVSEGLRGDGGDWAYWQPDHLAACSCFGLGILLAIENQPSAPETCSI